MSIKIITTIGFVIAAMVTVFTKPVSADIADLTIQTGCSTLPSYTASMNLKEGEYSAYVRLAKKGERTKVAGYSQSELQVEGECSSIGSVLASGDKWTKIGDVIAEISGDVTLQLSSIALNKIPDANRPSILLIPKSDNPICTPATECFVEIGGERGYVRPVGTLLNQNSLHGMLVDSLDANNISSVRYYTDNNLKYTSAKFENFDERYIEYPDQPLKRVVVYKSGQQVVLESFASGDHQDNFGNFMFRISQKYPKSTVFLIGFTAVVLLYLGLIGVLRAIRRRQDYRIHHGFIKERKLTRIENFYYSFDVQRVLKFIRYCIFGILVIVLMMVMIVGVSNYLLQVVEVDGSSMEKTYYTGENVFVGKLPVTLARLNGTEYIPKRGTVVTVRGSFGNAPLSEEDMTEVVLIKRVIALPGERIVIKDGKVTVFNDQNVDGFSPDDASEWQERMTPDEPTDNIDVTLDSGEIFVTGDNRPASIDSRFNGPIKVQEIIGVVIQ